MTAPPLVAERMVTWSLPAARPGSISRRTVGCTEYRMARLDAAPTIKSALQAF